MKVKELPYMFKDWEEYRDYLLEHLIDDPARREAFRRKWDSPTARTCIVCDQWKESFMRNCIKSILKNDFEGTITANFILAQDTLDLRRYITNGEIKQGYKPLKYTLAYMKQIGK